MKDFRLDCRVSSLPHTLGPFFFLSDGVGTPGAAFMSNSASGNISGNMGVIGAVFQ